MKPILKTIIWLTAFSVAMGFMETAVVVYLRKIYYPEGFSFPLAPIHYDIALTEFLREAATIIMLIGIGVLAGKNNTQRFAFFIYSFAIWDLLYYVFLKMLLDWPATWLTWDILFLIPCPWVGPVLAPCIVSVTLIALTFAIIYYQEKGIEGVLKWKEKLAMIMGCMIVIFSFLYDYLFYLYSALYDKPAWTPSSGEAMFSEIDFYIPQYYNWFVFTVGEVLILAGIIIYIKRQSKIKK